MKISTRFNSSSAFRGASYAVLASLLVPLAGCGSPAQTPVARAPMQPAMRPNTGMSTKQKAVLLAGAAAMYYYYQKSKKANAAKAAGQSIQYYLSKNGRVYYRDPRNPRNAIYVTPPPNQVQSVQVSPQEAGAYSGIQGYNNQQTGNGLDYYFNGPGGAASAR